MRISLDWLKSYIEIDVPFPQLIEKLNMIGLLVDEWEEKNGDIILDIETYANRPDTLGHLGIARELSVCLGLGLKEQSWALTETEEESSGLVDVQIWDDDLCPRYSGMIVRDVQVGPSPDWLREKIEAMGSKSINNMVDVTNYVLFSTAHPIHAFDLAKLSGRKIIIRRANKEEVLRSLENKDVSLSPEMLVIADEEKPVALAGVIGGEYSSVQETTQDVFIESAYFDPVSVRKTSKQTGITTDASYRFERGSDISFAPKAALMAASLLTQFGGKAAKGIIDVYPKHKKNKVIVLRHHRVFELIGVEIDEEIMHRVLSDLGFQVDVQQQGVWQIKIPHFRVDIEREADLIEEIARFYGYDKIPTHIPPLKVFEPAEDNTRKRIKKLRQLFFHYGFDEVVNYSFSNPEREATFQTGRRAIEIRNPVSSKASLLRTTLIGGMLENIVWNRNRDAESVHVFEIGKVYFRDGDATREQQTLAVITTGIINTVHWQRKSEEIDFFHLKGICESLMAHMRYEPFSFQEENHAYFEKGYSLALTFKGEIVGFLGLLKKETLDFYSLDDAVWAAELNLDALLGKQPYAFQYSPVAKFPSISRDISFVVDRSVSYQSIKVVVEKLSTPYLEKFYLYDRFSGGSIPKNKISLSLRFIYRSPQKTLQAEEVDSLQQKILDVLKTNLGFQLREGGKIDK